MKMNTNNGPIKRRYLDDGEWKEEIIIGRPAVDWGKIKVEKKHKKRPVRKPKKHKKVKTDEFKQFYKSHEWAKLRYEVLKESNGRCELCGRSAQDGAKVVVDHIKPKHKYPKLAFKKSNLQVLCSTCNWGKYGHDESDWRTHSEYGKSLDWIDDRNYPGLTLIK